MKDTNHISAHDEEITKDTLLGTEFGGCKILEKLGSGGMGSVYKARHIGLDKLVCIKVLPPDLAKDKRNVEFFLREARSVANIDHPNILQVYHIGQEKDTYYIIMSYIEGSPLSQIIKVNGALSFEKATLIIKGILNGLMAAHEKQIIHRDIKPSNVLVTKHWQPKIVDFGLAKKIDEEKALTVTGEMVGTAYFMAPEQGLGKPADHRTDLYSVGVTYFYILTAKYPYEGKNSIEVIHKHITAAVPDITEIDPKIPAWAAEIIEKLMQKDPADRFETARDVLLLIEEKEKQAPKEPKKEDTLTLRLKTIPPQEIKLKKAPTETLMSYEDLIRKRFLEESKKTTIRSLITQKTQQALKSAQITTRPKPETYRDLKKEFAEERQKERIQEKVIKFKQSAKRVASVSFFGFVALLDFMAWFSLGKISAQIVSVELSGLELLTAPWLGEKFAHNQLLLLGMGIAFILAMFAFSLKKIFSLGNFMVLVMSVSSYAAAVNGLGDSFISILKSSFTGFLSSGNLLIFSIVCAAISIKLLTMMDKTLLSKMSSVIFGVLSFWFTWHFASLGNTIQNPMIVFLIAGLVFLVTASILGYSSEISFQTIYVPPALLIMALIAIWGYPASGQVESIVTRLESQQELAIQKSAIEKKLAEDKGEKTDLIVIPAREPIGKLHRIAWKKAYLKPLGFFDKNARKNGSYMLIASISLAFIILKFVISKFKSRYILEYEL